MQTQRASSEITAAASILGSIRTEKKIESARRNLAPHRWTKGRSAVPIDNLPCTCPPGRDAHRAVCPRARAMKRRAKASLPAVED